LLPLQFSPTFFTETLGKFRQWLDELLREIIEQCYDVDLIVESPSTFGGIHAAEALEIGYMRAFTMPWTKTSAYPQAFSVPSVDLGPGYNSLSYELYEQVIWLASEGQINRWRRNMLGLASTTLSKLNIDQVPFMVSR
jgi:sterol 3beta-glucosyltransferase